MLQRAAQSRRNDKPWEEDPDMYGVRRSGRAKPVTKRFVRRPISILMKNRFSSLARQHVIIKC